MKPKYLTIALLVFLSFTLTACTVQDLPLIGKYLGNVPVGSKEANLNAWGLWESPEVVEQVISKYTEQNPKIKVAYDDRSVVKPDQYKEAVFSRLSQQDTPDIVLVHNSWVPYIKDKLAPMPENLMTASEYFQKFYSVAGDSAVIDNSIYAIPMYYDGLVLVYNKDHFEEIGQTTPPTAWEEFRNIAKLLTKPLVDEKGNIVKNGSREVLARGGAAFGTATNIDFASDILGLLFSQAGVDIPGEIDSRSAQDALTFYTQFANSYHIWDETMPEASLAFTQEKVSMIFIPSWNLLDILKARPDLNIGVAPVPQAIPSSPVSWGSFWMYAVPLGSANQKEAWEFIKFISDDEQQLLTFSLAGQYRAYGAPYSSQSLASQVSSVYLEPLLNTAPYAKSGIITARSGNKQYVDALLEAITSVNSTSSKAPTPEEALKLAKQKMSL